MRIAGEFTTPTTPALLQGLACAPQVLTRVSTLQDVSLRADGSVSALFVPLTSLGRIPLRTVITPRETSADGARLHVVGRRANQLVTVDLTIAFAPTAAGTTVSWEGEVLVGGTAASVGQRVVGELATRAVGQVLEEAAGAATAAEL